jgi:hypothetical protein
MKNYHNNPCKRQAQDNDFKAQIQAVFHALGEFWL